VATSLATPLAMSDILKAMEAQGIPRGTALGLLSIFGMGLQDFDPNRRKPAKHVAPVGDNR
jgi:hypothetical protein